MKRLKVLMSAYSCEPGKGSESGIGWNIACGMAKRHDVWVLTRSQNRRRIEPELSKQPVAGLTIVYFDVPGMPRQWDGEDSLAQIHYPLWQLCLYGAARRLHRQIGFDIAQHITWGRYWGPSLLSLLDIPFVWGPVGGGESAPRAFIKGIGMRARLSEYCRDIVRWLGEHDPFVRVTARRCAVALATTPETGRRLEALRVRSVKILGHAALDHASIESLAAMEPAPLPVTFLSMGRLLYWKGFHLALQAFAEAGIPDARYILVGDGPYRHSLESLTHSLGVSDRVTFFGQLPRTAALEKLKLSHVLVHPSLHDSGGWVCIEAMAAGRPVLCLDQGGPATFVDEECGVKIAAVNPRQVISELAGHMRRFSEKPDRAFTMGAAARAAVVRSYSWEHKIDAIERLYEQALAGRFRPVS